MDTAAIVGIGLTATALAVLLRQYKPEYAMLASLMAGIVILGMAFGDMRSVLDEVNGLISGGIMRADYAGVLLKALGICFVTQIACDSCRDAGESAIAVKLEMAGKVAVLAVSLPLFRQVMDFVATLMRA